MYRCKSLACFGSNSLCNNEKSSSIKALLIKCIVLRFKRKRIADNIDVGDPLYNGVEAFEISSSINTLVALGLCGVKAH
jgi:hypothetical protein